MEITFEPAREEDILPIYALNKALIDRYEDCAAIDYDRVLAWVKENIRRNLASFSRVLAGGRIAGYFSLGPSEEKTELDSLFILPEFQNRGIGTQILRYCQNRTENTLFLYVFKENTGAINLYKRLGFEISAQPRKTAWIMEYKKQD